MELYMMTASHPQRCRSIPVSALLCELSAMLYLMVDSMDVSVIATFLPYLPELTSGAGTYASNIDRPSHCPVTIIHSLMAGSSIA